MSSNCSTCSKSYYPLCSLKCRACNGRCPWSARRFNGGSSERSRRPDLPSKMERRAKLAPGGKRAREGGGVFGEKPTWDRSGRGNIMCSHTLHMTLVYVTTPSFPVYRDV